MARRLAARFAVVGALCRPCVTSNFLRLLWNGIPISARLRTVAGAGPVKSCLLACEHAEDRIEHYLICPVAWRTLQKPPRRGLGIDPAYRNRKTMLLARKHLGKEDIMKIAVAGYAIARTVHSRRSHTVNVEGLMQMYIQDGLKGSKLTTRHLRER